MLIMNNGFSKMLVAVNDLREVCPEAISAAFGWNFDVFFIVLLFCLLKVLAYKTIHHISNELKAKIVHI